MGKWDLFNVTSICGCLYYCIYFSLGSGSCKKLLNVINAGLKDSIGKQNKTKK